LIEAGDCFDPLLLEESERLLRAYPFIARAELTGERLPDGSWAVVAETQDEWTTKVGLDVRLGGEEPLRRLDVVEENLLGRGIRVGAFMRQHEGDRDIGTRVHFPRVGGTRVDTGISW